MRLVNSLFMLLLLYSNIGYNNLSGMELFTHIYSVPDYESS